MNRRHLIAAAAAVALALPGASWTAEATDPLWACTGCRHCTMYCDHANEPGLVRKRTPRLRLPRVLVRDWDGPAFDARLEHWLNG